MKTRFAIALLSLFCMIMLAACGDNSSSVRTVGMAYDTGGKGDGSFNDSAYAGLVKAQQELGVTFVERTAGTNETDATRQARLRQLAASGCNPVIAVGISNQSALAVVAPEFPATTFAIVDAQVPGPNSASLVFTAEQGSYLVGVIAASASKTGKIGFIGGMDSPLINAFRAGYLQGARSVRPGIVLESAYLGAEGDTTVWNAPDKAQSAMVTMLAQGVDIGYAAAGASNVGMFQAIKNAGGPAAGLWGIGVDSDQYTMPLFADLKEVILTSMLKRVDVAVFEVIKGVASGSPLTGLQTFDLQRGGVAYAVSNPAVAPYRAAADAAADRIKRGEIIVVSQ